VIINQKLAVFATIAILLMSAGLVVLATDESSASSEAITGDTDTIKTGGTAEYTIQFYESDSFSTLDITFVAKLVDSGGDTQVGDVDITSGSLTNGVKKTLTVTAPDVAGTYSLEVTFTEVIDGGEGIDTNSSQTIHVVKPVTFSVTLTNNGTVNLTEVPVYFYVDGNKIDDSKTDVTVAAGEDTTITYEYAALGLGNGSHTFKVLASENANVELEGLGEETTFYHAQSSYSYATYIMAALFVIFLVFALYVYRKPIKNYGKPKARR